MATTLVNRIQDHVISESNRCSECGGLLVTDRFQTICSDCGVVTESDNYYEGSYQFREIKNTDMSNPAQFVSIGKVLDNVCTLGTHIGYHSDKVFYDHNGVKIIPKLQSQFRRFKDYGIQIKVKNHETVYRIQTVIKDICHLLEADHQIIERACYFYTKITKERPYIPNHVVLSAVCIYRALREANRPLSIQKIVSFYTQRGHRVNPRLILRDSIEFFGKSQRGSYENYISMWISDLLYSEELSARIIKKSTRNPMVPKVYFQRLEQITRYFMKKTQPLLPEGCNPINAAGACMYAAAVWIDIRTRVPCVFSQELISQYLNIEEYSIRDLWVKYIKQWMYPFFEHKFAQRPRMILR